MHRKLALLEPAAAAVSAPEARCQDAQAPAAGYDALRAALYACFDELGNAIEFEGSRHTRVAALGMLAEIDDPSGASGCSRRSVRCGRPSTATIRRRVRIAA
jgi:hypothetical protein